MKDAYELEKSGHISPSAASSSDESFNLVHDSEAERSSFLGSSWASAGDLDEKLDADVSRTHGHPTSGWTGTKVFDKM
jgi:hypothetical protein